MARTQVTITLGRSGQKVVKRPWNNSDGSCNEPPAMSGSKRSWAESSAEDSFSYTNKRLQVDIIAKGSGHSGPSDVKIGGNDLRLKLLNKRMSRRIEEHKKMELRQKMSRVTQSLEGPDGSLLRTIPPVRRVGRSLPMESSRDSYSYYTMDGLKPRSPNRVPQISRGMSSSRPFSQALQLQSPMPIFASRTGYMGCADLLDPSHTKGPTPVTAMTASTRTSMDLSKPLKEFPPASSSLLRNIYQDENLTVSSLLHSLGLGKYAILFQAEEIEKEAMLMQGDIANQQVDMTALKQMGDQDLKELGIPMGPRKKILLAMLARSKRPTK